MCPSVSSSRSADGTPFSDPLPGTDSDVVPDPSPGPSPLARPSTPTLGPPPLPNRLPVSVPVSVHDPGVVDYPPSRSGRDGLPNHAVGYVLVQLAPPFLEPRNLVVVEQEVPDSSEQTPLSPPSILGAPGRPAGRATPGPVSPPFTVDEVDSRETPCVTVSGPEVPRGWWAWGGRGSTGPGASAHCRGPDLGARLRVVGGDGEPVRSTRRPPRGQISHRRRNVLRRRRRGKLVTVSDPSTEVTSLVLNVQ